MGAQQNLCGESCIFAVIKPALLVSLHTFLITPPLLTSQLEKPCIRGIGSSTTAIDRPSNLHKQKSTMLPLLRWDRSRPTTFRQTRHSQTLEHRAELAEKAQWALRGIGSHSDAGVKPEHVLTTSRATSVLPASARAEQESAGPARSSDCLSWPPARLQLPR